MTKKQIILSSLAMVVFFFTLLSCNEKGKFGYDVLPENDKFQNLITDTVTIDLYTLSHDTALISQAPSLLIGSYNDPVLGQHSASCLSQFRLPFSLAANSENVVDSAVLILSYSENTPFYGDKTKSQLINFYIAGNNALGDTVFSWEDNLYKGDTKIGSTNLTYPDTNFVNIRLDDDFAKSFFDLNPTGFFTNTNFLDFLPGIYMTPDNPSEQACIHSFNAEKDTLKLYYHPTSNPDTFFYYSFTSDKKAEILLGHLNFFEHNYSSLPFYNMINQEEIASKEAYLQAMTGLRVKLKFPYIKEWAKLKDSIAILRAEIVLPGIEKNGAGLEEFSMPPTVFFNGLTADGQLLSPGFVQRKTSDNEYRFDIADYLSGIIEGTAENNGFMLSVFGSGSTSERAIFSTEDISSRARLVVTYTKLPK